MSHHPTGTEARVCELIAQRQALGIAKYGQTVAENPLSLRDWLQHQLEELLDAAVYAQRAIEQLDQMDSERNDAALAKARAMVRNAITLRTKVLTGTISPQSMKESIARQDRELQEILNKEGA
ncbi:hypothetical protein PSQ40_04845 [Curvibacter sp. HBC61]|uniref:Uncharacterized protein n=1 Tax=Curvibacter cyanobacteriorum TaxID=3026422 RepID=A0ABT5MYP9_9BURK|nr:hypothetical protein [Curvibacter sp. HBC61]MDD0837893.1 hypothetical protein [Curvibacter sp. HBC61]